MIKKNWEISDDLNDKLVEHHTSTKLPYYKIINDALQLYFDGYLKEQRMLNEMYQEELKNGNKRLLKTE